MEDTIARTVPILRDSPNLSDESIYHKLLEAGIEQQLAARLVELLPIAYCRVTMSNSGIRFSKTFRRKLADGSVQEREFSSEPVWDAANRFARAEIAKGVPRKDLLNIAARSAEFHAINQLLNQGSKMTNVRLTAPLFTWPEQGLT